MKLLLFLLFAFKGVISENFTPPDQSIQQSMVNDVNKIRESGCYCGRKYMAPVQKVEWNNTLFQSAMTQAKDMRENNFFKHYSNDGLNIGERLKKAGYDWLVAGENLGEGQVTFEEVLEDWLKSYTHCTMLMHPRVEEMAVAREGRYWVQHFGKKMPEKK